MVGQSTTFLPLRKKVMTRNAKHLDPYLESPQMTKRTTTWKERLPLSKKLRTTIWIVKAQGAAAATQSKDLRQKLSKFSILVIVAHTVYDI
jgi:hypothetical protein